MENSQYSRQRRQFSIFHRLLDLGRDVGGEYLVFDGGAEEVSWADMGKIEFLGEEFAKSSFAGAGSSCFGLVC